MCVCACVSMCVNARDLVVYVVTQVRLPGDTSDDVDEDPSGSKAIWDRGLLSGAAQKVVFSPSLSLSLSHAPSLFMYLSSSLSLSPPLPLSFSLQ